MRYQPVVFVLIAGVLLAACGSDKSSPTSSQEEPGIVAMSPGPSQSYIARDQVFVVEFSAPMERASVEAGFHMQMAQGPVVGTYEWNDAGTVVTFHPSDPLPQNAEVQVQFGGGMHSRQGRSLRNQDGQEQSGFSFVCNTYDYPTEFSSNGERIYFTGISASGNPITFSLEDHAMGADADHWSRISLGWMADGARHSSWNMPRTSHGGGGMGMGMGTGMQTGFHGMTCASCHGPDGQGGRYLAMGTVETPDIRYETLVGVEEHAEDETEEHADEETAEHADEGAEEHADEEIAEHAHAPYTDDLIRRAITQGLNPDGEPLNAFMPRWSIAEEDLEDLLAFLKTL